jgi:hypothetical protein
MWRGKNDEVIASEFRKLWCIHLHQDLMWPIQSSMLAGCAGESIPYHNPPENDIKTVRECSRSGSCHKPGMMAVVLLGIVAVTGARPRECATIRLLLGASPPAVKLEKNRELLPLIT